jgi:hypothetical protein
MQPMVLIEGDVLAIAFAPDGRTLAAAQSDARAVRPVPGAVAIVSMPGRQITARLRGHTGAVRALAFDPDGKTLTGT